MHIPEIGKQTDHLCESSLKRLRECCLNRTVWLRKVAAGKTMDYNLMNIIEA